MFCQMVPAILAVLVSNGILESIILIYRVIIKRIIATGRGVDQLIGMVV